MSTPFFPSVTAVWEDAAKNMDGKEIPADRFLHAASEFVPIFGAINFMLQKHVYETELCFVLEMDEKQKIDWAQFSRLSKEMLEGTSKSSRKR